MHFICRSIIGSLPADNWAQYWENEPDDPLIVSLRGHLFGLIDITASSDISIVGHHIISALDDFYFDSSTLKDDIPSRLLGAIDSVNNNPDFSATTINSLVLAIVHHGQLYLASYNSGRVILYRSPQISLILSASTTHIAQISGPVLPGDRLLIVTGSFYDSFNWEHIKASLSETKIQNIEENLLSSLYSLTDQSHIAAALIEINEEDVPIDPIDQPVVEAITNNPIPTKPVVASVNLLRSGFSSLRQLFIKSRSSVYVSNHDLSAVNHRKKFNIFIALILLLALTVSSVLGYRKNKSNSAESQYQQYKVEIEKNLSNAVAVKNLNLDSALELGRTSRDLYQKMQLLKLHQDEMSNFDKEINSILSQTGSADITPYQIFYDTTLIADNTSYSKLYVKSQELYLLDTNLGRLDVLDTSLKNTKNIATLDSLKSAVSITDSNGPYLLATKGIYSVSKNNLTLKIDFSTSLTKSVTPIAFQSWNGSFYLIDSSTPTIFKFTPNSSGFGQGQVWLKDGESLVSNPVSLAINGKVWTLSSDGTVTSYTRGVKEPFKTTQTVKVTNANHLIVTQDDSNLLAFTDADNLIYLYKKTGELHAKYNLSKLKILDISFNDKSTAIFVLCSDQKIYQINL